MKTIRHTVTLVFEVPDDVFNDWGEKEIINVLPFVKKRGTYEIAYANELSEEKVSQVKCVVVIQSAATIE